MYVAGFLLCRKKLLHLYNFNCHGSCHHEPFSNERQLVFLKAMSFKFGSWRHKPRPKMRTQNKTRNINVCCGFLVIYKISYFDFITFIKSTSNTRVEPPGIGP